MAGSAEICNSYAWTKTLLSQRRQTRRTAMLGRTSWLLAGAFALTAALLSGSPLGSHSAFALGAGGAGGAPGAPGGAPGAAGGASGGAAGAAGGAAGRAAGGAA